VEAIKVLVLCCALLLENGCAYHLGSVHRSLPGSYKQVSIPVFKNKSQEVGIEVPFTNNLILEFQRSRVARVVEKKDSDIMLEGTIDNVTYVTGGTSTTGDFLAKGAVIATEYRILIGVTVRAIRQIDGAELWRGSFSGETTYSAPQVTLAGVNSVNPLYNLSARRQNIESKSVDMMSEAHDRITENF
jgi:TolB-like protein